MCVTKKPCYLKDADTIDFSEGAIPREEGEVAIASYLNFLIVNGGIILPQYGDENDALAVEQVQAMFPDRKVVGVKLQRLHMVVVIFTVLRSSNQQRNNICRVW